MKFSAAATRLIGTEHADQRLSASYPSLPASSTIATDVADAYSINKTPFADRRDKLASLQVQQYVYAEPTSEQFLVLSAPIYATLNGTGVMIASLGDDMKVGAIPVTLPVAQFRATFAGLVVTDTADQFALARDPTDPDTIPGQDPLADDGMPSVQRLQFGPNPSVLASLPVLCAIPPGVTFPTTLTFDGAVPPSLVTAFPFFDAWSKSIVHAFRHNDGKSLELGGPLLNKVVEQEDPANVGHYFQYHVPSAAYFAAFQPREDLALDITTLCAVQHGPTATKYRANLRTIHDSAYMRIGEREIALDQVPEHLLPSSPNSGGGGGGGSGFDAKEFAATLGETLNKHAPAAPQSLADKSHLAEVSDMERYFQLLGASKVAADGAVMPAKLTEEFTTVLAATPMHRAQELLATMIEVHLRTLELEKGDDYIVKNITLVPDTLKGLLGAAMLRGKVFGDTLVKDPTQCKKLISFVSYMPPRTRSAAYKEQLDAGTAAMIHELTGEHASKRDKKLTELVTEVQASNITHIVNGMANLFAIYSFMITDFDKSLLWTQMKEILGTVTSRDATSYFDFNRQLKQVYLHLVIAVHNVLRQFHAVAINPLYRSQLKKTGTTDKALFQDAVSLSKGIARNLKREMQNQSASLEFQQIPTLHVLFPHLNLVKTEQNSGRNGGTPKPEPASKKPRTDNRNDTRTDARPSASAGSSPILSGPELEQQRKSGFLKWTKSTGVPAAIKFFYAGADGTTNRVCFNGISQGPFCRYGSKCHAHHPKSLADIPNNKQREFCKTIEVTDGLEFMPGKGPAPGN